MKEEKICTPHMAKKFFNKINCNDCKYKEECEKICLDSIKNLVILSDMGDIANEHFDGHYTMMKFTTNYRFCFGTPIQAHVDESIFKKYRSFDAVPRYNNCDSYDEMFDGSTVFDAISKAINSFKEDQKIEEELKNDLSLLIKDIPDYKKSEIITRFKRDYKLRNELKQKYKECMVCGFTFKKKNGEPYNEIHHIISLAKNGKDEAINTLILCANCHRQLHYANVDISNILSSNKIIINGIEKKIHSALNGV